MIALSLSNVKNCMAQLLLKETFDDFLFIEGEIVTAHTFTIDGFTQKSFFEEDTADIFNYALWKDIRDYCFSIIKGRRTPLSFKFIFSLNPIKIASLVSDFGIDWDPSDIQGLYLNFKYDGEKLQCITGTSLKTFSLDKTIERVWDRKVQELFSNHEIAYENLELH